MIIAVVTNVAIPALIFTAGAGYVFTLAARVANLLLLREALVLTREKYKTHNMSLPQNCAFAGLD